MRGARSGGWLRTTPGMIGVIADPSEEAIVREFFELFKTPWEFYRSDRRYEVLLCTRDGRFDGTAKLVLFYAGRQARFDSDHDIRIAHQQTHSCFLLYQGSRIPMYGETVTFSEKGGGLLKDESSCQCAAFINHSEERVLARIGYDLFGEVGRLLTAGQPPPNADIPTLELHIALLRDIITGCGVPLVEIPPVPEGYRFITCLTHDVDHPSIRQHRWDHTMFGFLYRAVLGSLCNFIEGRLRLRDLVTNWTAASKLPFVHLGLAKDFWREFDDRYLEIEKDLSSTFFVIAFKNYSGESTRGRASGLRASPYSAREIADTIQKLMAAGCEIGVHGVDAWLDHPRGREELDEIRRLTGVSEVGARMHWLYYDHKSPAALEMAGASYDSTIGYNETVGYRAGTTQAYKPLQATRLLELPLHVMDTALFYPAYLGLSPQQAKILIDRMIENAIHFGGCLTINWHDRSIFPERLWGTCYRDLLEDLKIRGAWFSTAGQAVAWFRKRRAAVFETDCTESEAMCAKVTSDNRDNLPRLRLRIHEARPSCQTSGRGLQRYTDIPFDKSVDTLSATRVGA
jgi:hypothetical protein